MADLTASFNKYYLATINDKKYLVKIKDSEELKTYAPVISNEEIIARADYAEACNHVAALQTQTII